MVLAYPGGHISILLQYLTDGTTAFRQNAHISIITRGHLTDSPERNRVVITTRDQRRPRWTAKRRRMKAVKPQAFRRKPVHRGRRHAAAEGAELAKTGIIQQDKYNIGRTFWRPHRLRKLSSTGLQIRSADLTRKTKVRSWQNGWRTGCVLCMDRINCGAG